ncbi:MAG TPA: PASTA domain-containing protein [Bacteroidota bacterium]|nr:PASTA domain-containing protein [Bacteroidota bacterium]
MKDYKKTAIRLATSTAAKYIYIVLGVFAVLLTLLDMVIMPWYVNRPTVTIPSVVGMNEEEAIRTLKSLNLEPLRGDTRLDKQVPEGSVVAQNPEAQQVVKEGRRVYLTISGGEKLVTIPSFKGSTMRNAKFTLDRLGLKEGAMSYAVSTEFPEGTIISQEPPQGAHVRHGGFVNFLLSAGASIDSIVVPDLIGKSLTDAQKQLIEKGLTVGNVSYQPSSDLLPNTVIEQLPRALEIVTVEKNIDLVIASPAEKQKSGREN